MRMTEREALTILSAWLRADDTTVTSPDEVDFAIGIVGRWSGFAEENTFWIWDEDFPLPFFTRDFSAALNLVPGDCKWSLEGDKSQPYCETAHVWCEDEHDGSQPMPAALRADMNGAAAALAAAALKARWRARQSGRPILPDPDWETVAGSDLQEELP